MLQLSKIYESVILELRSDLERRTKEVTELQAQIGPAKLMERELEALREELQLYQEAASSAKRESNRSPFLSFPLLSLSFSLSLFSSLSLSLSLSL